MATDRSPIAPLPFGIPQLDQLLGFAELERQFDCLKAPTSVTIVGQDGTGKSVFALHAASHYQTLRYSANFSNSVPDGAKHMEVAPCAVFYVSSDLRFAAARKVWDNFYLGYPWHRYVPFISAREIEFRSTQINRQNAGGPIKPIQVRLADCLPGTGSAISCPNHHDQIFLPDYLDELNRTSADADTAQVAFIDLATQTTGDDWLFVARLLASVPRPRNAPPNLLILDSVAGFETLVGERNSFGEEMSRRARIAQLIRAASDNWHLMFVVEEPDEGSHHPEEYVTDTVVHLRRYGSKDNVRRMLEIEKSRARSYGSGEHPFEIRDGLGSSTQGWENPDDPHTLLHNHYLERIIEAEKAIILMGQCSPFNAYIQVFPSLHYLSRDYARLTDLTRHDARNKKGGTENSFTNHLQFGVRYLDNMLAGLHDSNWGLPGGTVTSIIGDEGTLKSELAEQFLREGFRDFPGILRVALKVVRDCSARPVLQDFIRQQGPQICNQADYLPASVKRRLRTAMGNWLSGFMDRANELQIIIDDPNRRLLTSEQLREALGKNPFSSKEAPECRGNRTTRPLMARWDILVYSEPAKDEDQPAKAQDHEFLIALSMMRLSSGLLTPVVLVTTDDTSSEDIADRIFDQHSLVLLKVLQEYGIVDQQEQSIPELYRHALLRLIERFIVVRRIELLDSTAPQLWHIIQRSVIHALSLLGHKVPVENKLLPFADEIRVVISDLCLIRDIYPAVADDPLFLPTIVFRLRRMGVTALIVDSDNGRPDLGPSHAMNGALRSLADHQIYTWKVSFFGEQRVAISVIPPIPGNEAGIIRELKYQRRLRGGEFTGTISVDPHFELYQGIEQGKPEAVPLEVVLYAETPAFEEYIESEKALFSRLFSAANSTTSVIQVQKLQDYDGLRDFCHLPIDTRLPFTLVFMVDGYWAMGQNGALRNQTEYLFSELDQNWGDVFGLFRTTAQQKSWAIGPFKCRADFFVQKADPTAFRKEFYYRSRIPKNDSVIDRVPFMWDFGFLLCNEQEWFNALDIKLPIIEKKVRDIWEAMVRLYALSTSTAPQQGDVDIVRSSGLERTRIGSVSGFEIVSWREFLEACTVVAKAEERRSGHRVPAFDLAGSSFDSLLCWIFEIWFSEILSDAFRLENWAKKYSGKHPGLAANASDWATTAKRTIGLFSKAEYRREHGNSGANAVGKDEKHFQELLEHDSSTSLADLYESLTQKPLHPIDDGADADEKDFCRFVQLQTWIKGYSLQLYKMWLLLLEVVEFTEYYAPERPFELKASHEPPTGTVAARHWYKTACATLAGDKKSPEAHVARTRIPVRMPGYFSMRGDWFLAVAKGSRSSKLADRALDMLTSRRANYTRLSLGLGLPTRDIMQGENVKHIRTRLSVISHDTPFNVTYGDLLQLSGDYGYEYNREETGSPRISFYPNQFFWLFRTGFKDFDRQAITIRKWVFRLFNWTVRYRHESRSDWHEHGGFYAHDQINAGNLEKVGQYASFTEFAEGIDVFINDLDIATLVEENTSASSSSPARMHRTSGAGA